MTKKFALKVTLATAISLAAFNAQAYDGVHYICRHNDFIIDIDLVEIEHRVQAYYNHDAFAAILAPNGQYVNQFEKITFIPSQQYGSKLQFGSSTYDCTLANDDTQIGKETFFSSATGMSLGGSLRDGPGMQHKKIGSLPEGSPVNINSNTGVNMNGYDWFKVSNGTDISYQWGGIMCSDDRKIDGIFKQC